MERVLCACGCGELAPVSISGHQYRFRSGHFRRPPQPRKSPIAYFWQNIQQGKGDECWEWNGNKNHQGYGHFHMNGDTFRVHRFSYELHFYSIPKGILVCHTCDNPPCCNPKHLFLGTHQDNMNDKVAKGRSKRVKA